nr:CDP-glycerol glycerophosphotransferase family protein [Erysipelotrichales bacterium]
MEKYILSIIIDCHYQNDIDNINETISSFNHVENIEVILLNSLCKNFQNVKYVDKDSFYLALTEAKNICLGKYTYIIEAGDRFYQNSLNQLLVHLSKEKYDIVHFNLIDHKNHFQVEKTYLNRGGEEYTSYSINKLPIKLKETFFKTELIKTISFLEQMDNSFELDFFAKIIKDDNIKCYKDYSSVLEYYHDSELVSIEHSKTISAFLQEILLVDELSPYQEYYTLNEIKKYLSKQSIKYHDEYFDDDEKKEFLKVFKNILSKISIIAIQSISSIVMPYKNYLLELKFDDSNNLDRTIQKVNKKSFISYQDNPMFDIEGIGNFKINVLESKNNILILDGVDVFSFLGHQYQIIAIDDHKNTYKPQLFKWTLQDRKGFIGDTVYQGRRFRFEIPLNQIKHIKFVLRANGNHDFELNPSFGNFAKLVKKYRMSYYAKDNYIFQYRKKGISIIPKNWKCHLKFEIKFMIQLFKLKKINAIILRFSYYLMNIFLKKPVWLMRDNEKRAKDSGAEMFKYFSTWDKKSDYNGYFILDHHCSDYQNMRKYGKIIQPESFRYKLYHLLADKLIDTRGSVTPQYIFKEDYQFVSDLCQWDYIWLIHGIMTRNESTWTNKYAINAKLFATCNDREYQSVLDEKNGYGYSKKEVALTGLPRHDALSANKQKKILFLPTWRKHLAGDLIPGTSDRSYVDNFKESDFFQFYNSLINDERLLTAMKEKGYKGDFYLHPSFMKQCYDFDENEFIHIGKEAADTNKLIGESSILLTDYSSAQFEGAYLDTPVIYPQYDAETFSDNHTGQEGYFDYERDGFGPVCYNLDQTVKAIIEYLENDCQNKEPYQSRARDFFAYRDHNNSQRVFEQILKIDGQSNKDIKIEEDNENVYLYQGIDLKNAVIKKEIYKLYNPVFHLNSFVKKIKMKQKSFVIDAEIILDEKDFRLPHDCFKVSIGSYSK